MPTNILSSSPLPREVKAFFFFFPAFTELVALLVDLSVNGSVEECNLELDTNYMCLFWCLVYSLSHRVSYRAPRAETW